MLADYHARGVVETRRVAARFHGMNVDAGQKRTIFLASQYLLRLLSLESASYFVMFSRRWRVSRRALRELVRYLRDSLVRYSPFLPDYRVRVPAASVD